MINFLEISTEIIILIVTFFVFFFSGLAFFYYPLRNYENKKKRCSISVEAEVIGHDLKRVKHSYLFSSIYRFNFNNNRYEIVDISHNNLFREEIGSKVQILINPENPQEIISRSTKLPVILTTIMGLLIMGVPALIGFLYLLDFLF